MSSRRQPNPEQIQKGNKPASVAAMNDTLMTALAILERYERFIRDDLEPDESNELFNDFNDAKFSDVMKFRTLTACLGLTADEIETTAHYSETIDVITDGTEYIDDIYQQIKTR